MRRMTTTAGEVRTLFRDGRSPPPRLPRVRAGPHGHRRDERHDRGLRLDLLIVLAALASLAALCGSLILAAEHWVDRPQTVSSGPPLRTHGPCGTGSAGVPETADGSPTPSPRGPAFSC